MKEKLQATESIFGAWKIGNNKSVTHEIMEEGNLYRGRPENSSTAKKDSDGFRFFLHFSAQETFWCY